MKLKPWQEKMWCIPHVNAEYVARMEDVLDLYAEAPDPRRPVVGFDETPRQLIGEARVPIAAEPGKPRRVDYEYVRNGTANVFMFVDVNRPWRHAKVTDQRTCIDFAECMRDLVDVHYPKAERIRVVLDNLSAHSPAALYQAFAPAEARRILSRLEFHFTPKRQLAQHGRDRDRRNGRAVPRSPDPRPDDAAKRDRRMGATTSCREGTHQMDVYRRSRSRDGSADCIRSPQSARRSPRESVRSTAVRY